MMMLLAVNMSAQRFYNLTADEVSVDSILPAVGQDMPLPSDYNDSVYVAEILYPEFIDMGSQDIENYKRISGAELPELPIVERNIVFNKKKPVMVFSLMPLVYRDGKYKFLVSFMLKITSKAKVDGLKSTSTNATLQSRAAATPTERYASHSILASGKWAKISVSQTGYHELTNEVIKKAGFTNLSKVHVYGYGGNLVPEKLSPEYLISTDDLKPVKTCTVNGKRVFYAKGPVSYDNKSGVVRTRNPYSDYGYYFITQNDEPEDTISVEEFSKEWTESNDKHYNLYEVDNYAWYSGGRNLYEATQTSTEKPRTIQLASPAHTDYSKGGRLFISVAANAVSTFTVEVNDSVVGKGRISNLGEYDKASVASLNYMLKNLKETNTVTLKCETGGPLRLDYVQLYVPEMASEIDLNTMSFPAASYVYNITNQDHHADIAVDMTILIPTSQTLLAQAERLKKHHEEHDGLTVRIVPADELYNEFSSGTPDISAYRRYMKMMYDRAEIEEQQPKYLLLFGDCLWDNRLKTSDGKKYNADNLLLCFESDNSYSELKSFVSDDFIGMLDDNEILGIEGQANTSSFLGTPDIGVGRFPVSTVEGARVMVDKTIAYARNSNVGTWQNVVMFMGDDGNDNLHMRDVNTVADNVIKTLPGFNVRKVMWDSFKRVETSTGNRYPDVENLVKSQQKAGALIMDYAGHGAPTAVSHEYVLKLDDFEEFNNTNLPLWITASCDVGPYDGVVSSIGKTVVLNPKGGGVAFFGTTRTVYANYNKQINNAFVNYVLSTVNGKPVTLGDASRMAKTYLVTSGLDRTVNKIQYALLGDPALALNVPTYTCVIDSINGYDTNSKDMPTLRANSKVSVVGHITNDGVVADNFSGLINAMVYDNSEMITCLDNDGSASDYFRYNDRTKKLYSGTDSVNNGRFCIRFVIPRDINYSDEKGKITLFAYTPDGKMTAHGETEHFIVGGSETVYNDSIGPSVYCYLNSPSFQNGGDVNSTPFFVAEITDNNGINASGAGIGHDMQLIIDNDSKRSYSLNDNFQYDFGSYTTGSTYYYIPELEAGPHTLLFRAWDILNNPTSTVLAFNVVKGLDPEIADVSVSRNPAKTSTTFIVTHNRPGADLNVEIEIFDMSGRLLHSMEQSAGMGSSTCAIPWDLTVGNGGRLQTGVYLYRVNISCDGSKKVSKAKKLVVL